MRRCCFMLIRLRPAAIIIGAFGIFFAILSVAIVAYILAKLRRIIDDLGRTGDEDFRCILIYICIWYLLVALMTVFISVLLIMGSVLPSSGLVLPWMVLSVVSVLFTGFNLLLLMATFEFSITYTVIAWLAAVVGSVVYAYLWMVVRSLYRRLLKKEAEEMRAQGKEV